MDSTSSFFLDGTRVPIAGPGLVGAELLKRFARGATIPDVGDLPYLFCGNGSCRDCNLLVEGLTDVASCRIPAAPGLSVRSGEGAGEENALSRRLPSPPAGEPLVCDVLIVGAGRSGRAAARAHRDGGASVEIVDARARPPRPAAVFSEQLVVMEKGRRRAVEASTLVLATGAKDVVPSFPGSLLPGVFSQDLVERYAALEVLPGRRLLLVGGEEARKVKLENALRALGAEHVGRARTLVSVSGRIRVERVFADEGEVAVDTVAIAGRRVPSLALAKALGCRTRYDRELGDDVLELDDDGRTSEENIFAVGAAAHP